MLPETFTLGPGKVQAVDIALTPTSAFDSDALVGGSRAALQLDRGVPLAPVEIPLRVSTAEELFDADLLSPVSLGHVILRLVKEGYAPPRRFSVCLG